MAAFRNFANALLQIAQCYRHCQEEFSRERPAAAARFPQSCRRGIEAMAALFYIMTYFVFAVPLAIGVGRLLALSSGSAGSWYHDTKPGRVRGSASRRHRRLD